MNNAVLGLAEVSPLPDERMAQRNYRHTKQDCSWRLWVMCLCVYVCVYACCAAKECALVNMSLLIIYAMHVGETEEVF